MLTSDPAAQFEELKGALLSQIEKTFPIQDKSGRFEVRVKDLNVTDNKGTEDIKEQQRVREQGRSWEAPVHGTVEVVDLSTGKTLVSRKQRLTSIPKMTRHYSWIIGGQELTLTNQWRLRPGAYVKATERPGEYEAQFQLAKGKSFDIQQEEAGNLYMKIGGRKIPLYSVLHNFGVSDDAMKRAWGEEAFESSKKKSKLDKDLVSLHTAWRGEAPTSNPGEAVKTLFASTQLDPEIAKANVGVHSPQVNGTMLLEASRKLIDVSADRARPDPIDSLRYKELWTAKDHIVERLARSTEDIATRVRSAMKKPSTQRRLLSGDSEVLRDVVMPDLLRRPMYYPFTTSLAAPSRQTNPIAMLADRSATTIMGPGGIQNQHQITASNTAIDPSHLGFLDPVFTPEGNPGVTTHLAAGVRTSPDRRPVTRLYNLKTKKLEDVDAARASTSVVVLPDQVKWEAGHPKPRGTKIKVIDGHGELRDDMGFGQAHYVMPDTSQVFALETNLVPFMQNDSAGRTTMSARHMAQAISVVGREPPMVRVEAGGGKTFEELIGSGFLSHRAPVSGIVTKVAKDEITLRDSAGKAHSVHLYNHYPTNETKGMLHSTPLVQVGQAVKMGQVLADNNHTKNGALALGTNVRAAYLANGYNHEDGIVISESAAAKLASQHLYKPSLYTTDSTIIGKKQFLLSKPGVFSMDRLNKIDDDGTVKVGTKVKPGDPLILALGENRVNSSIDASTVQRLGAKLRDRYSNSSLVWDSNYEGEVVGVHRSGRNVVVHVKTLEPAQIGSKISTRHSAKGIVTQILADKDMPHDDKGRHVEMLINSVSVPGRQNPGQILETAAGKIAEKTGKPYVVKNFMGGVDYLKKVQDDLKAHGLKETETLYDPKTGRRLGEVTVGPHYVFQLEHQIDKKTHVRSGGPPLTQAEAPKLHYDADTKIPRGGGHHGAQSLGALGIYSALASGLHSNLQEMQTLKSDEPQARAVWAALTNGDRLPPPKVPFVYRRFEAMLQGLGVNLEKDGTVTRLVPRTDEETRKLSRGELSRPTRGIRGKDDAPERGGLFDPIVTGGREGQHWSHIELAERMPHPVYAEAISKTLSIKPSDIPEILAGKKQLNGKTGAKAFEDALSKLNVDAELKALREQLASPRLKGSELNKAHFKYKALETLKSAGKKPVDAWMIKAVPVIPPVFRPVATMPDNTTRNNPLNTLYRRLGMVNETLQRGAAVGVPWDAQLDARAGLYQELNNLFGTTPKGKKALDLDMRGTKEDANKKLPGIIHMISGEQPKDGFFQDKMIGKKQDYTARATIVADPNLSVDQLGVPRKIAMELMRPMVAQRLIRAGYDAIKANLMVSRKDPIAMRALEEEIKHRPVLMKRDPVLHQYGLVGQHVKLVDHEAITMSPLVLPPIGGDLDGDTVSLYVPLGQHAVEEIKRIVPSARTISASSGDVLYTPANESALSLYRVSLGRKKTGQVFADQAAVEKAFKENKIDLDSVVHIKGVGDTTLGRVRIAHIVPEAYKAQVLTKLDVPFDRKLQNKILSDVAKNQPKHFVELADNMSRLGFQMAYETGHSVTLKDLEPLRKERDTIVQAAQKRVDALPRTEKGRQEATKIWLDATKQLHDTYGDHYTKNPTNVSDMAVSGIKAKKEQFQGLVMAPMLVEDHLGRPSKIPITKSFSEGIDVGGYFVQAAGARRGVIQKVESVSEPGYMSKLLVQMSIDQPVMARDCGTTQGISMGIKDRDIVDRHLAAPVKIGSITHPAGTVVTPDMLHHADKERVTQLQVRSPLKCRLPQGVCSRCMGTHPSGHEYSIGENVGVIAAQALGERAAQLMLKQTHGGGIVSLSPHSVRDFSDVQAMLNAAKPGLEDAVVATRDTKISRVEPLRQGSWELHFEGSKKPVYTRQKPLEHVKPGYVAKRGEVLTQGSPNIHSVLEAQGIEAVQNYMTKRIGDIYGREGVLRRHVELGVRNVAGLVRVEDPGEHSGILRGDYMMKPTADALNHTNPSKAPIKYEATLKPMESIPLRRQKDFVARLQGENISRSLTVAVQHGHSTDHAGIHPIPGLAHGAGYNPRRGTDANR